MALSNTKTTVDDYWPEVYDQLETQTDDVRLLRELIGGDGPLRILEPFCGNGRILIPLAEDGHEIVGMDKSRAMLRSAEAKIGERPADVCARVTLIEADVTSAPWPDGFDLAVLGANCFYEVATAEEQEGCVRAAAQSLKPRGRLFLDNNHMEGELDRAWRNVGEPTRRPDITCADGAVFSEISETIWYDASNRLWRSRRRAEVRTADGRLLQKEYVQQKHPPSTGEMRSWLEQHGFEIAHLWGDRFRSAYTDSARRAIIWATRREADA